MSRLDLMNKYIVCFISVLLIGCGGGGSSSNTTVSTPSVDIDTEYSGLKISAKLNPDFSKEVANDFLFFEDLILTLLQANDFFRDESLYNANSNLSEPCEDGGNVSLNTSKSNGFGISLFSFDKCMIDGNRAEGAYQIQYNFTTYTIKIEFKNYNVFTQLNESLLINGTVDTSSDGEKLILNLLREIQGKQLLVKNLSLDNPYKSRTQGGLPTYDGKFFYSDQGKVDVDLTAGYTIHNSFPYFKFSEGAFLQIEDELGNNASFQFIDENGYAIGPNGSNEIVSAFITNSNTPVEINFSSDEEILYGKITLAELLTAPSAGLKPIANEVLSNGEKLSYSETHLIRPLEDGIQFDGTSSIDPEGALLAYDWRIIESPAGSEAKLSSNNSASPKLIVDYLGAYKVELVVTDGVLESDPKIISIEVGGPDFNPLDRFGGISWIAKQLDGSFSQGPTFRPLTSLDIIASPNSNTIPEFLKFDISWNLIERPSTSNSSLMDSNSRNPQLIPDEEGKYTLEATVNNGFINVIDTKSIEVLDFIKSVTPKVTVFSSGGSQTAYIDSEWSVRLAYEVVVGSTEFSSSIELIEQPANSSPQVEIINGEGFDSDEAELKYKFDKAGRYIYKITGSNGNYDTEPMDFVFNVHDSLKAPLIEDTINSTITPPNGYAQVGSMAMGDIDKDGYNDIVIVYEYSFGNKYQLLYGKTDGTFTQSSLFDAPSDDLLGLIDVNNDSNLELLFRIDEGNSLSIVQLAESEIVIDPVNHQPFGEMPITFDSSYYIHSMSDINNDGLKDVVLLKKGEFMYHSYAYESIAYSLQLEGNFFASLIQIPISNKFIQKVSHDEINNSLLIVSSDVNDFLDDEYHQSIKHVDEFKYQQSNLNLESTSIINYAPSTPFGTKFYTNYIVDLDGDGIKEIIGSSNIAGFNSTAIWKKNSSGGSYDKSQKISIRYSTNLLFADMDLDGDIDIVNYRKFSASEIIYQDENKQFNHTKLIERDEQSEGEILPYVFDADNDGDSDMLTINRFTFNDIVPYIRVFRNATN